MTTTLSEGVKVPDVGSVNWAGDLEVNWNLLNGALANLSGNVKTDRDNTWTGEQSFTLPIVGSITGTAAKAIADEDGTSIKSGYVNVAGNQTVTGDKSFTGSNTFNNILPNATNTYSLGSSSYQWSSVYAQTYYYNGTAWGLDKSNTWTQNNRYTGYIESQYTQSGGYSDIRWLDELDAVIACFRNQSDNLTLGKRYTGKTAWYYGAQFSLLSNGLAVIKGYDGTNNSSVVLSGNAFYPDTFNINLGTSSKKWSTINGINPGALSLPDYNSSAKVDISGSIMPDAYGNIRYTPTINGWLYVCFNISSATTGDYQYYIQAKDNSLANSSFSITSSVPVSVSASNLSIFFPVIANKQFIIQINFSNYTIIKAHVIPCLGNV